MYLEIPIVACEEVDDYHETFQLLPSSSELYYPKINVNNFLKRRKSYCIKYKFLAQYYKITQPNVTYYYSYFQVMTKFLSITFS